MSELCEVPLQMQLLGQSASHLLLLHFVSFQKLDKSEQPKWELKYGCPPLEHSLQPAQRNMIVIDLMHGMHWEDYS